MANPAWSDATRNDIHQDLGYALGLGGMAYALEQLLHPQNGYFLLETTDEIAEAHLATWRITAGKRFLDTDANGWIWITYDDNTPGGGSATVNFYNDSARSVLVAVATGTDGATLTIVPQTGYTLAGTVDSIAATADFSFRAQLIVPPAKALEALFDNTSVDDSQLRDAGLSCLRSMRSAFGNARAAAQVFAATILSTKIRRQLASISSDSVLIPGLKLSTTSRGTVIEQAKGLLEDLRLAQKDNGTGSGVIKAAAATLSGSPAFPGWTGVGTGPTYGQRGFAMVVTFTCDATLTERDPTFRAVARPVDTRRAPDEGRGSLLGTFPLSIGKEWKEPAWGILALVIDYSPTGANSTGTSLSTVSTDWSVVGLKASLSDGGKLWTYYNGTTLGFYDSEDARDTQDADHLVCQATLATTDDATTFHTATTDSGIVVYGKTGAGTGSLLVAGDKGSVDFNVPTPNSPASYFTLTIAETTQGGRWVQRLRDGGVGGQGWYPHTAGTPNLQGGWIDAGLPLVNAGVLGIKD